jgi:hypothetical protein
MIFLNPTHIYQISIKWEIIFLSRVVQSSRKIASPNIGFLRQLEEFQVCGCEEARRRLANKFFNTRLEKRGPTFLLFLVFGKYAQSVRQFIHSNIIYQTYDRCNEDEDSANERLDQYYQVRMPA